MDGSIDKKKYANSNKKNTLRWILYVLVLSGVILLLCEIKRQADVVYISTITIFTCFSLICLLLLIKFDWSTVISYLLVYTLGGIVTPLILIFDNGIMSSGTMLMVTNIAIIFVLLEGIMLYISVGIMIFVDAVIISNLYYHSNISSVISKPNHIMVDYQLALVITALVIVFIILRQRANYKYLNSKVEESKVIINKVGLAKSRFLANMSQEIRTPVNAIVGISEIMQEMEDEGIKNEVQTIRTAAYDMLSVIDDVLNYSKLDTQRYNVVVGEYSFEKMLHNIIESISIDVEQKNLKLDVRVAHNIPSTLIGDEDNIRRIFLYLLFVSLSMTTEGRILLQMDVNNDLEAMESTFKCTIADTGRGLSPIDVDSLFGLYSTYNSRQSSDLKGIGLKFIICKEILKLMDGTIEVKAIERVGMSTIFTFKNKIVDVRAIIKTDLDRVPAILIFLDEEASSINWKEILDGFGINIKYVGSRYNFIKSIEEKKYDYIFLSSDRYEEAESIISKYSCESYTYVVGNYNHNVGDFGKCRLLRRPLSCIDISQVLNAEWKQENYSREQNVNQFMAPNAKVLVVDDNAVNLKVAAGIFNKFGIKIAVATGGVLALEKIEKEHYDLILTDMIMPEMNGEEVLKQIRNRQGDYYQTVPVIALTANTGGEIREELIEAGFQEYLAKPIKMRYLSKCLQEYLPKEKIIYNEEKKDQEKQMPEKGLFVQKGMNTIGVGEDVYFTILNTYYQEGKNNLELLPELLENGDIMLFTTYVHGIKSASASLGAFYVSALFKELETLGKENDIDEIKRILPQYMEELAEVLDEAEKYLEEKGKLVSKDYYVEPEGEIENISPEELEELRTEINKMNLKACDEILERISHVNYGNEINEHIKNMKTAYQKFDFHRAKQELSQLLPNEN